MDTSTIHDSKNSPVLTAKVNRAVQPGECTLSADHTAQHSTVHAQVNEYPGQAAQYSAVQKAQYD